MNIIKNIHLETQRLIIRPYIEDDLMECFYLMQDKELFKYKPMHVMTLDEFTGLFKCWRESYNVGSDKNFAFALNILLKETGVQIGWVGLCNLVTDPSLIEIFYLIGINHQNKDYATEASKAILEYGFNTMNLDEIVAACMKNNIASRRVMEKIGLKFRYIQEGLTKEFEGCNGDPFYSLTKEEYLRTL